MRLILSQAQELLAEYVEYGMCATDPRVTKGINLAMERLLPALNPEKTVGRYQFDVSSNNQITCPREVKAVLAASMDYAACTGGNCGPGCCTTIYEVKGRWYEFLPGGPVGFLACSPNILSDLGTGFSTFEDPSADTPMTLRLYADLPQASSEGNLVVNALDANGNNVISYNNNQYVPGVMLPIPIQGQNYVDSTMMVSQIISVTKPQTVGRLRLFGVHADGTQVALAVYEPDELNPDYRRYLVSWPVQPAPQPAILTTLAKRRFIWTTSPYSDLLITNVGAFQNALMAMKYEKAGAFDQAAAAWKTAITILDVEDKDYDTDYTATVQIQSNFTGGDIWSLR
jgi:hypothetical protein